MVALASCFAFPGEFLLQASKRLAPPLGGHARSPIRRANNRLRLSAGSPGHRRIPPVAVFALRDVRAGFMFAAQAIFCACLGLLFRLPRRVPFASVQKEPKDSPRHPAPAASRLGCPRCIVAPGGTPPRSFVDRGGSRGILPLVPLRNDSARPPDGAGLPPHHLEGKPPFVHARNPIRRADNRKRLFTLRIRLRYVEVWHARGHPPPEAPLSPIESFRSPPAPHARRYSPARPPTGTTARRRAPSTAGRSATVCSSAGPSRESGCNARSR